MLLGSWRDQITLFFQEVSKTGLKESSGFTNYFTAPLSKNKFEGVGREKKNLYWVEIGKEVNQQAALGIRLIRSPRSKWKDRDFNPPI